MGNIIKEGIVKPDPEKIETIRNYPLSKKLTQLIVRSYLGLINYCRVFPQNAAKTKPLFNLVKGESKRSIKAVRGILRRLLQHLGIYTQNL